LAQSSASAYEADMQRIMQEEDRLIQIGAEALRQDAVLGNQ